MGAGKGFRFVFWAYAVTDQVDIDSLDVGDPG